MSFKRFCVNCGKQTDVLIDSLCPDCYLLENKLLDIPRQITLDLDWRSEKVRVGRIWREHNDDALKEAALDKVSAAAKPQRFVLNNLDASIERNEKFAVAHITFSVDVKGVALNFAKDIRINYNKTISDASMKILSYYHEAIIQVRFLKKPTLVEGRAKLHEVMSALTARKKKVELSEAIDTKNVRGGFDILVGSAKAAKFVSMALARKYGITPIYSNTMIGLNDNGTTKYRHTYCLKFDVETK